MDLLAILKVTHVSISVKYYLNNQPQNNNVKYKGGIKPQYMNFKCLSVFKKYRSL